MLYRFCTFSSTGNRLYRKQGARDVDARRAVGVVYKRGGVYMSELAFLEFEKQIETLPLMQLRRLRNKIDILISHTEPVALSPITSRLLGVAQYDGNYDELLQESISEKWQ